MNPNRKAEIQRKLTMASVPKPPAGLAERIKADIPQHLTATNVERDRFTRSVAFNLRVAASILLLVGSLFVVMRVMRNDDAPATMALARSAEKKSANPAVAPAAPAAAPSAAADVAMDELRVDITETAASASAPERAVTQLAEAQPQEVVTTARGRRQAERAESTESRFEALLTDNTNAPAPEPAPAAPPAAPVPPPTAGAAAPAVAASSAPAAAREASSTTYIVDGVASANVAFAADLPLGYAGEIFGISVNPEAFRNVKSTIEQGARPAAEQVNVEALMNYFAGGASDSKRNVRLDVEASRSPVEKHRYLLRLTVDTAKASLARGASAPPVATDAKVEINIDPRIVAKIHRLGGGDELMAKEPRLLANTSVTALFELDLFPTVAPWQRVATVTMTYTSVADGKRKSLDEKVIVRDFRRQWSDATRRHRLASLGAVWATTLKGQAGAPEVARQAKELATEAPKDAKARELATLANASSEGGF
ncbi:MAG TPA: von Willebrand factor type A domain-containing protein [Thermoanaerobaculia bacterium]|jgi:hypothetical protein